MQTRPANWASLLSGPHVTQYRYKINGIEYSGENVQGVPVIEKPMMQKPVIGRCCAGSFSITIRKKSGVDIPKAAPVTVDCRLVSDDGATVTDWIPQGRFWITKRYGFGSLVSLTCRDGMLFAGKTYVDKTAFTEWPVSMANVFNEIVSLMGVQVDSRTTINTGAAYKIDYPNEDVLMSEILGMIAAAHGGNFIMTESGKIRLVPFPATSTPVFALNQAYRDYTPYSVGANTISRVTLMDDAGNEFTSGTDTGIELIGDCSTATQTMVNAVANSLINRSFIPYQVVGAYLDPCIELGDTISAVEHGVTRNLIANTITVNCTNGYTCQIENGMMQDDEEEIPYSTPQELENKRTVKTNQSYHGNRINRQEGFVSEYTVNNEAIARLIANSNTIAMQWKNNGSWKNSLHFDAVNRKYVFNGDVAISGGNSVSIQTGGTFSVTGGNFSIDSSGNVTMSGTVNAANGTIGGWTIGSNALYSDGTTNEGEEDTGANHVQLSSDPSSEYAIWSGSRSAASAPFRVTRDGILYVTKLIALENDTPTPTPALVNLQQTGWKLNYHSIKSYTTATYEQDDTQYCTSLVLSNGTTLNFKRAADSYAEGAASVAQDGSIRINPDTTPLYFDSLKAISISVIGTLTNGKPIGGTVLITGGPVQEAYDTGYNQGKTDHTVSGLSKITLSSADIGSNVSKTTTLFYADDDEVDKTIYVDASAVYTQGKTDHTVSGLSKITLSSTDIGSNVSKSTTLFYADDDEVDKTIYVDASAVYQKGKTDGAGEVSQRSATGLSRVTLSSSDTGSSVSKTVTVFYDDDDEEDLPITINASAVYAAGYSGCHLSETWGSGNESNKVVIGKTTSGSANSLTFTITSESSISYNTSTHTYTASGKAKVNGTQKDSSSAISGTEAYDAGHTAGKNATTISKSGWNSYSGSTVPAGRTLTLTTDAPTPKTLSVPLTLSASGLTVQLLDGSTVVAQTTTQPLLQTKTATSNGTVTADSGYNGLSSVTVNVSQTPTFAWKTSSKTNQFVVNLDDVTSSLTGTLQPNGSDGVEMVSGNGTYADLSLNIKLQGRKSTASSYSDLSSQTPISLGFGETYYIRASWDGKNGARSAINTTISAPTAPTVSISGSWNATGLNNVGYENTYHIKNNGSEVATKAIYLSSYGNATIVAREDSASGAVVAKINSKYNDGWNACVGNISIRGGKVVNNSVPSWTLSNGGTKYLSAADDYYRVEVRYKDSSGNWQSGGDIDIGHAFILAGRCQWRYYDEGSERWINYNGGNVSALYYINA